MRASALLILLALFAAAVAQPVHGQTSSAGVPATSLGLGLSPGTVEPVDEGVPVYTVGDQVWFEYYGSSQVNVTIFSPEVLAGGGGSSQTTDLALVGTVPPDTPVMVLTFSPSDAAGWYVLSAGSDGNATTQVFEMVKNDAQLQLQGYSLTGTGELALNYALESPSAYGATGCLVGAQAPSAATIPVPSSIGSGDLLVSLNGSNVVIRPQNLSSGAFSLSLGLSQYYGYSVNQSSAIISRSVEVAQAQAATISETSGSVVEALQLQAPLRAGALALTASFGGAQVATGYEAIVLVTGTGSWLSMQGCSAANPVSDNVSLKASLSLPPSDWPRWAYVAYEEDGVPMFQVTPVSVQPAVIDLTSPDGATLTDSQVYGTGPESVVGGTGALYVVALQYPVSVTVHIPQNQNLTVVVPGPFSSVVATVPGGDVVVKTLSNGASVSGVDVSVTDARGAVDSVVSANGEAVFHLPAGNYTAAAAQGTANATSSFVLGASGRSVQVELNFVTGRGDQTLPYLLVFTALVGVIASTLVWGSVYAGRRRRRRDGPTATHGRFEGAHFSTLTVGWERLLLISVWTLTPSLSIFISNFRPSFASMTTMLLPIILIPSVLTRRASEKAIAEMKVFWRLAIPLFT